MDRESAVVAALLIAACTGASAPEAMHRGHFGTWESLVRAAKAGDVEATRQEARDLAAASSVEESDGASAVGAAVGFLLVADADDLWEGVEAVGRACAACHEGVAVPPEPNSAEARTAWALVWPTGKPGSQ